MGHFARRSDVMNCSCSRVRAVEASRHVPCLRVHVDGFSPPHLQSTIPERFNAADSMFTPGSGLSAIRLTLMGQCECYVLMHWT